MQFIRSQGWFVIAGVLCLASLPLCAADWSANPAPGTNSLVVNVENPDAITDFQPNDTVVQTMVNRGVTNLTHQTTVASAWRSLVTTQDVVGLKVFSEAGELSGTRPAVVAAVVRGLLAAGVPASHIIIWDQHEKYLRAAGFFRLGAQLHVRVAGGVQAGYDPTNFYQPDTAIIGSLVWGDLEFGKTNLDIGRKSFVSQLVSRQMTKIISLAPLLNHEAAGTCGHLYSLALGSVDNTMRFDGDPRRLAVAVPELYALRVLGDRVVLNITDALIAQYAGGPGGLLQYSTVPGQLWFSRDPVALDVLAMKELDHERRALDAPKSSPNLELYLNATLLQLGTSDPAKIHVQKVKMP
jgi:hypothetical protein